MSNITTASVIAKTLRESGVRHVFGHPGGEVVDLIEALAQEDIEFILTGHESAAAFMAGAVGRLTGQPGVCLATLGPGACNLVLGVSCALLDKDPMLAITARTESNRINKSQKQNLQLNEMFAPITKWSVVLSGGGTAATVQAAITVANTPPHGPVYLTLPADVATAPERAAEVGSNSPILPVPDDKELNKIIVALNKARRPIGVIGLALDPDRDVEVVGRFFNENGIPYAVLPRAKGLADETGDYFLGAVAPAVGDSPTLTKLLAESDCLLGIGFDPVDSSQTWHYQAPVYSIATCPTGFRDYQPEAECTGDVSDILGRLTGQYESQTIWSKDEVGGIRENVWASIKPPVKFTANGLTPYYVVRQLQEALPSETILTTDVGAHKVLISQAWRASGPRSVLMSNGLSAMGYGLPAALVASFLHPNRPVVGILGDGGFAMMVQELETALRMGVTPLLVVLCDRSLAIIKTAQDKRGIPHRGVDFLPVDWARVTEGFGARGESVSTFSDLEGKITKWLARRELTVLAVEVDGGQYTGLTY